MVCGVGKMHKRIRQKFQETAYFRHFSAKKLHKTCPFDGIIVSVYRRVLMAENTLDKMPTEYLVQMIDTQKQLIESQSSQIERKRKIARLYLS